MNNELRFSSIILVSSLSLTFLCLYISLFVLIFSIFSLSLFTYLCRDLSVLIIEREIDSKRGRERWRRMDHLQHWRNGSLRSVHSSYPSLSLTPGRPRPNPVITQATTEQSERASKRAEERRGNQRTREGGREAGCYWAHSTQRRRPPLFRPPARSLEHSPPWRPGL